MKKKQKLLRIKGRGKSENLTNIDIETGVHEALRPYILQLGKYTHTNTKCIFFFLHHICIYDV